MKLSDFDNLDDFTYVINKKLGGGYYVSVSYGKKGRMSASFDVFKTIDGVLQYLKDNYKKYESLRSSS